MRTSAAAVDTARLVILGWSAPSRFGEARRGSRSSCRRDRGPLGAFLIFGNADSRSVAQPLPDTGRQRRPLALALVPSPSTVDCWRSACRRTGRAEASDANPAFSALRGCERSARPRGVQIAVARPAGRPSTPGAAALHYLAHLEPPAYAVRALDGSMQRTRSCDVRLAEGRQDLDGRCARRLGRSAGTRPDARAPLWSAVFEGIRCYETATARGLPSHGAHGTLRALGEDALHGLGYGVEELVAAVKSTIRRTTCRPATSGRSRSVATASWARPDPAPVNISIACWPWRVHGEEALKEGVDIGVSSWRSADQLHASSRKATATT